MPQDPESKHYAPGGTSAVAGPLAATNTAQIATVWNIVGFAVLREAVQMYPSEYAGESMGIHDSELSADVIHRLL